MWSLPSIERVSSGNTKRKGVIYSSSSLACGLGLSGGLRLGGSRLLLLLLLLGLGFLSSGGLSILLCELHGTGSTWVAR